MFKYKNFPLQFFNYSADNLTLTISKSLQSTSTEHLRCMLLQSLLFYPLIPVCKSIYLYLLLLLFVVQMYRKNIINIYSYCSLYSY
jgi:hypothetical protein